MVRLLRHAPASAAVRAVTRPTHMSTYRVVALATLLTTSTLTSAQAQETRAEAQRQQREEKQRAAKPYAPTTVERALKAVETGGIPLITRDGLYAKLGSLTTGSGFAYGAGYRTRRFFSHDGGLDVWAWRVNQGLLGRGSARTVSESCRRPRARGGPTATPRVSAGGLLRARPRLSARRPDRLRAAHDHHWCARGGAAGRHRRRGWRPRVPQASRRQRNGQGVPSIGDQFDDATAPGLRRSPTTCARSRLSTWTGAGR